jgi:hypothetical protein
MGGCGCVCVCVCVCVGCLALGACRLSSPHPPLPSVSQMLWWVCAGGWVGCLALASCCLSSPHPPLPYVSQMLWWVGGGWWVVSLVLIIVSQTKVLVCFQSLCHGIRLQFRFCSLEGGSWEELFRARLCKSTHTPLAYLLTYHLLDMMEALDLGTHT